MIIVDKHTDPNFTVVAVTSTVLEIIKPNQSISYHKLQSKVVDKLGKPSLHNYIYAIDLLFLLGVVKYNIANDTISRL